MDQGETIKFKSKPETVVPSKYEGCLAIHSNRRYWKKTFDQLDARTLSVEHESKQLLEILPKELYHKVCNTLDIPVLQTEHEEDKGKPQIEKRKMIKAPLLSYRKTLDADRDLESDTDVEHSESDEHEELNVHRQFLNKPIREQVTWSSHYLMPEREDEKSLVKKADDLTDKIASDFCEYINQLGGNQQSQLFTPKAVKELFQIEFDTHVARSIRVIPKELPAVDDGLAEATGVLEKSKHAILERQVTEDIKAEQRKDITQAFGRSLPLKEVFRAPHNDTEAFWRSARHVPKDLVTLKTVWEGITNLRSVREYCHWMIEHPEYYRASYLKSLGLFDPVVLAARQTFEMKTNEPMNEPHTGSDGHTMPIAQIRKRLSELAEPEKES